MTGWLTTKRTFLAVVFLGLFALALRNVTDPDVWWHLKTGEYIAEMCIRDSCWMLAAMESSCW